MRYNFSKIFQSQSLNYYITPLNFSPLKVLYGPNIYSPTHIPIESVGMTTTILITHD